MLILGKHVVHVTSRVVPVARKIDHLIGTYGGLFVSENELDTKYSKYGIQRLICDDFFQDRDMNTDPLGLGKEVDCNHTHSMTSTSK